MCWIFYLVFIRQKHKKVSRCDLFDHLQKILYTTSIWKKPNMKYCKLIFGAIVLLFAISADGKSKKFDKTKICISV